VGAWAPNAIHTPAIFVERDKQLARKRGRGRKGEGNEKKGKRKSRSKGNKNTYVYDLFFEWEQLEIIN